MSYRYRAYGLTIASEIELPELLVDLLFDSATASPPDVAIVIGSIPRAIPAHATGGASGWATAEEVCFKFDEGGRFLIRAGREIVLEPANGVEQIAVRLFLLGPVLGTLLHQRGLLVLHASAIAIGDVAVAFLADKGTGKSTLAAAFHASGHRLMSDDIVPVNLEVACAPMTYPGFPQLKLFPEAAEQLGGMVDELPRLLPNVDKRARRIDSEFSDQPLPLRRLYVLCDGDADRIEVLPASQAFISLVKHSFVLPLLRATSTHSIHFQQSIQLAKMLPVRSLLRRRDLALLPDVVRLVEKDVSGG